jgi:hypothetical protein
VISGLQTPERRGIHAGVHAQDHAGIDASGHQTIRCTRAMALGVTDHIWSIEELIDTARSAPEPKPAPPASRAQGYE